MWTEQKVVEERGEPTTDEYAEEDPEEGPSNHEYQQQLRDFHSIFFCPPEQ